MAGRHHQTPLDYGEPLDSSFEPAAVFVPSELNLQEGRLVWTMDDPVFKVPRGSVLEKFRRLHLQKEDATYSFAKDFGVAWFCQHHLPGSHGQVPFARQFKTAECFPRTAGIIAHSPSGARLDYEEDFSDYFRFSRAAEAIVTAAGTVNAGEIPSNEVFLNFAYAVRPLRVNLAAFPQFADGTKVPKRFLLESARLQIDEEVNLWLKVSQVCPELRWDHRRRSWRRTVRHSPWGVLGAVALALFTTVPQTQGWLICSICGDSYSPERPPVAGRNHYCKKCRNTPEMWRLLKRQSRSPKETVK